MKKTLLTLLLSALCVTGLAVASNAGITMNEDRSIPYAATAPTIDGVFTTANEWKDALAVDINNDNTMAISSYTGATCPDSTFYFMWSKEGLYFFADVKDTTTPRLTLPDNTGHCNMGDAIQLCMFPNLNDSFVSDETQGVGKLYFWSMSISQKGNPLVGEHFVYGESDRTGNFIFEVVAACTRTAEGYTYEAFFPASLFVVSETPIAFYVDGKFAMTNIILESSNPGSQLQALYADSAWFNAPASNKYVFVDDLAGEIGAGTPDIPYEPEIDIPVNPGDSDDDQEDNFNYEAWYSAVQSLHNRIFYVNATGGEGGSVSSTAMLAKFGTDVHVTITADAGYKIADVFVDNKSVGAVDKYVFDRINTHHVVTAVFEKTEEDAPLLKMEPAATLPFTDVAADAWCYADIQYVFANGLMNGTSDTTFEADGVLNRAMIVTTLWRQEGCPTAAAASFSDVAEGQWYTDAINWAAANGIVLGYGDGTFAPEGAITGEEAVTILRRYAALKGWDTASASDSASVTYSSWATDAVKWADKAGLLASVANFNDLTAVANRGQIAALLTRLCTSFAD